MHIRSPLLLAAIALVLIPASAGGRPIVTAENVVDRSYGLATFTTDFSFTDRGPTSCLAVSPCIATLTIKRSGKTVFQRPRRVNGEGGAGHFYSWACKRTGLHTWTATYAGGNGTVPTPPSSGRFTVGKCSRSKYRVSRGRAAAAAAKDFPDDDYVSRSRCRSRPPKRRLSASWLCAVTHYNNIRECITNIGVHYFRSVEFGAAEITNSQYFGRRRCRAF